MDPLKPYGLTKEQDLRWACLHLVACTTDLIDPRDIVATADVFADFVSEGFDPADFGKLEPKASGGVNVITFGRRPA